MFGKNVTEIRVTVEGGKVIEVVGIDTSGAEERYITVPATVVDYDIHGIYEGLSEDEFGNPALIYSV
jgi:hypothetical protein